MPTTNREVFGREDELVWLDACWNDGIRVATIVAFGGVGKSALVNEWWQRLEESGWRGAERVYGWSFYRQGMGGGASSDTFFDDAFKWFEDPNPPPTSPWEKGRRLAELIQKERTLLILDGVEPLQEKPQGPEAKIQDPALASLIGCLKTSNSGMCLLTTRINVADIQGRRVTKVRTIELQRLSDEAGADLLRSRKANGSKDELHAASREYNGHALALTLLGTYVRAAYSGDIRQRHGIPSFEGDAAQRMMATYEVWFADKPELSILRLIGLFDRPAPVDEVDELRKGPAIAGLTDRLVGLFNEDWNIAVTNLRDVGLVAAANAERSLDVHPLVREYYGKRLQKEQPEAFREGHRRLYEYLKISAKVFPETIREMAPLYAAVVHGCLAGKHKDAFSNVWWNRVNRRDDGFNTSKLAAFSQEASMMSAFFEIPWERVSPTVDGKLIGFVLHHAGYALGALGRLEESTSLFRRARDRFIEDDNWGQTSRCMLALGEFLEATGQLTEAAAEARRCLKYADSQPFVRDDMLRRGSRTLLAGICHAMGKLANSSQLFQAAEATQRKERPDLRWLLSVAGFKYCVFLLETGIPQIENKVEARAKKCLELGPAGEIRDRGLQFVTLGRVNVVWARQGKKGADNEARRYLRRAIECLREGGVRKDLPLALLARAALHIHTGALPDARVDLDEAMDIATHCGFRLHEADAHLGYARLAVAESNATALREHLKEARRIIDDTGYHRRDREVSELENDIKQLESSTSPFAPKP